MPDADAPRLPDELARVPDIRTTDLRAELGRCAKVLRWVETLSTSDLISTEPPREADDLVSVVVPMYDAARWIEDCLKGVLAQTHGNLEIFCVDDCSNDDTFERVVHLFGGDPRFCVVRLARNVGPFQISNWVAGFLARGRRIAWQDADNVSHPGRIAAQCRWMSEHGYRASGTGVHHFFPSHIEPYRPLLAPVEADGLRHELILYLSTAVAPDPGRPGLDSPAGLERAWERNEIGRTVLAERGIAEPPALAYVWPRDPCSHASQVIDTNLFREFGGFDGLTKLSEDTAFDWRISQFHDIGNLPRVLCSRRSHDRSLTRDAATGRNSEERMRHRAARLAAQEQISNALAAGNVARARELCQRTLHRAEIRVDRAHLGFDVDLS